MCAIMGYTGTVLTEKELQKGFDSLPDIPQNRM